MRSLTGIFLTLLFCCVLTGCGGGGGTGATASGSTGTAAQTDAATVAGTTTTPATTTTTTPVTASAVSGTAAKGAPLAGAEITMVDTQGNSTTGTAGSDGKFSIDVSKLTPPCLIRATSGTDTLYGIAYQVGTANVTPLSTAALAAYFQSVGTTSEAAFASPTTATFPSASTMDLILRSLMAEIAPLLGTHRVPQGFSPRTTPFDANGQGFDACLDAIKQTDATTLTTVSGTVTTTITLSGRGGRIECRGQHVDGASGRVSEERSSTQGAPTGSRDFGPALDSVNRLLARIMNVINARGARLQASDISSLLPSGFQYQGQDAATFAANLVTAFAGNTMTAVVVTSVDAFDASTRTLTVQVAFNSTTQTQSYTLTFQGSGNGDWRCTGDPRPVPVANGIVMQNARTITGTGDSGFVPQVSIRYLAPQGAVNSVAVTDSTATFFPTARTSVPKLAQLDVTDPRRLLDEFALTATSTSAPAVGSVFTLDVLPFNAVALAIPYVVRGTTTDTIADYQLAVGGQAVTHDLASVTGQTVNASWTLPKTFIVWRLQLAAVVRSATLTRMVPTPLERDATSGTLAIPSTLTNPATSASEAVTEVVIMLEAVGPNGVSVAVYDDYK